MAPSPRFQLRDATAEWHDRVDGLFARLDLGNREDYRRFLASQAAALLPVEEWLDHHEAARVLPDWGSRRRGHLLREDLADLDTPVPAAEPIEIPGDDSAILGAAYVLEGSRLGGAMLVRQVPDDLPRRFLSGEGKGDWRGFVAQIDRQLTDPADLAAAIATARSVFTAFEQAGRRTLG